MKAVRRVEGPDEVRTPRNVDADDVVVCDDLSVAQRLGFRRELRATLPMVSAAILQCEGIEIL